MSVEDKLTHDERLRLESVAQSVALHTMKPTPTAEQLLEYAGRFETFVRGGESEAEKLAQAVRTYFRSRSPGDEHRMREAVDAYNRALLYEEPF